MNSQTGELRKFNKDECQFSYRHSFFKTKEGKSFAILRVALSLKKNGTLNKEYKDIKLYEKEKGIVLKTPEDVRQAVLSFVHKNFQILQSLARLAHFLKTQSFHASAITTFLKNFPTCRFLMHQKER